jgi:hypothetical protein
VEDLGPVASQRFSDETPPAPAGGVLLLSLQRRYVAVMLEATKACAADTVDSRELEGGRLMCRGDERHAE